MARLAQIEKHLAELQNVYEEAAEKWYEAQREIKKAHALALLGSKKGSITEKKAEGDVAAYDVEGSESEAMYESVKGAIRVLETRASIGMSLLKAQGRA
jgi:hypothetical protein